jgi:hypothetical protein
VWTVNPSIPLSDDEIWALDIVFDPAQWDFTKLVRTLPQEGISAASYKREPRLQAYWSGPTARALADDARAALVRQPGIVSVELGRAVAVSRPGVPGSGVPPGSGP